MKQLHVALLGLGFGLAFLPIYLDHPDVTEVSVYDPDPALRRSGKETYPRVKIRGSFEEILADGCIDAVHLVTPIPLHAEQTVAVLKSGKHCACTVPMATSLEDLRRICDAVRESGKTYMMMETTLYTYQFLYVKSLLDSGKLGRIQFLRGSHYQDMRNWPDYWMGLPPMWYGTHAIAPMRVLAGSRIEKVSCLGSGTMDRSLHTQYGNPFPVESAHFWFANGLKGESTRSLFETARAYQEGLFVYGSDMGFEWGFRDEDEPYVTTLEPFPDRRRGANTIVEQRMMPIPCEMLPEPIRRYTVSPASFDPQNPQKSLKENRGGGHHGSHPYLIHEFVSSILEQRRPAIDEHLGANITGAGICAHVSAMRDGEPILIPEF